MIIFINDDSAYLDWLAENPHGFVVNAENPPRASNLVLHSASCGHLNSASRTNWTTKGYLKLCSNEMVELAGWASRWVKGTPKNCQVCKPDAARSTVAKSDSCAIPSDVLEETADPLESLPFVTYPTNGRALLGRRSTTNSRRGYGLQLHRLTGQRLCAYCGFDLFSTYEHWLTLQVDHVVPTTMGKRLGIPIEWMEDYSNLVLACAACNTFENQFEDQTLTEAPATPEQFFDLRDQIFRQRKPRILACQQSERLFFEDKVRSTQQ